MRDRVVVCSPRAIPVVSPRPPSAKGHEAADVLVVESTLAGCVAAWKIARQGKSVVVASSATSLAREIAICLRPWAQQAEINALPKEIAGLLRSSVKERTDHGELIFDVAEVTRGLEDLLLDAGAAIYYDVRPCGVVRTGRHVCAVLFACKAGLVALRARSVVDCTGDARVAALAGAPLTDRSAPDGGLEVRYSMLCRERPPGRELSVPGVAGLVGGKVTFHGPFAEFRMRLDTDSPSALRDSDLALKARCVATEAAEALRRSGVWKQAAFARGGDALLTAPTRRLRGRSRSAKPTIGSCRPPGVDNLLVCSPAIDVDDEAARALADPFRAIEIALLVARADWGSLCADVRDPAGAGVRLSTRARRSPARLPNVRAHFSEAEPIYRTPAEVKPGRAEIPVVADCDVLVVGGGTSGVPAALVAARNGADTLLVEKYSDVGGTHTIGGVPKYWFGRRTPFVRQLDRSAAAMMSRTGMPKCLAMLDALKRRGVRLALGTPAAGALVENGRVRGAVVVTPGGLAAITARAVIDATGDGDVAAWAGADYTWGTARDAMTLWFSFGHFKGADTRASRQYHSTVDLRDPTDVSRAIIAARRRTGIFGKGEFPQYYLAPRESRHIKGRATVTYADILSRREYPDTILTCQSNFDIKGIAGSDLAHCGYTESEFRKNYTARIPYRALLPEKLEGILVIGKAYSATHDALSLARMQRDLMAMGGAAGLAASMAVQDGKTPSSIDVQQLQQGLVNLGVLTESDLARRPSARGERGVKELVGNLARGDLSLSGQVTLLCHGKVAVPFLTDAMAPATQDGKVQIARALCFLGRAEGVPTLLAEIRRQLAGDKLPRSRQKAHQVPDHGYAPQPAFLINAVGLARDRRVVPILAPLARRIRMSPKRSDDMFQYVFCICYAAERIADAAAVEALEVLADKPGIRSSVLPVGADPRKSVDFVAERQAYLELCVGRALARCGAPRGYRTLIDYLQDQRGFLARSAREELVDLMGKDLGYAPAAWRKWLDQAPKRLPPKAYLKRIQ